MATELVSLQNADQVQPKTHDGAGIFSTVIGPEEGSATGGELAAGVWDILDFDAPTPSGVFDRDEFKYIVRGEAIIKDEHTGKTHELKPGTLLWIPAGSKASLVSSKNCKAIYVEKKPATSPNEEPDKKERVDALQTKLDALVTEFIVQNKQSEATITAASKGIPGGTTRSVLDSDPFPLVVKSGKGATLTSVDDKTYVDYQSDFTAGLFGHSHPDLQHAITEAAMNGFSLGATTALEGQLSEHLRERFPSIEQVRFCNSGTEANLYAIAAGLALTGRKKVLVFDLAYHGGVIGFGAQPNLLNIPHDFVVGTYGDVEKTRAVLSGDIGVIIVEPLQSSGGMRPAGKEFLSFLRQTANVLGAVLVFDEVVTSRLDYHGMQGQLGISPDMTTLGKYIGGGLPFGAFGGSLKIMSQFDRKSNSAKKLSHSGTFNNNIFTMSAAVAASKIITREAIDRTNALGDRARRGIAAAVSESGKPVKIIPLGMGSCVGIYFADAFGDVLRDVAFFHLLKSGIWMGRRGFLALNFAHTEEHIDAFVSAFREFLELYC